MPNLNPTQLMKNLEPVVDKFTATQYENAKPAAKLANGLMSRISGLANDLLQIAKDCAEVALKAMQRYTFVGYDAPKVTEKVAITPVGPTTGQQQPSSSGGHH
jgi:hypothetical protein